MGRNKEDVRWAPENLSGKCAVCPKPATRKNCEFNIGDRGSGGTSDKRRDTRCGIAVEPPSIITGFRKLKHMLDDLEGIPFGAGAVSAQGTRNVYADKHVYSAVAVPF